MTGVRSMSAAQEDPLGREIGVGLAVLAVGLAVEYLLVGLPWRTKPWLANLSILKEPWLLALFALQMTAAISAYASAGAGTRSPTRAAISATLGASVILVGFIVVSAGVFYDVSPPSPGYSRPAQGWAFIALAVCALI